MHPVMPEDIPEPTQEGQYRFTYKTVEIGLEFHDILLLSQGTRGENGRKMEMEERRKMKMEENGNGGNGKGNRNGIRGNDIDCINSKVSGFDFVVTRKVPDEEDRGGKVYWTRKSSVMRQGSAEK
ncbi:hypothetical protein Tco_0080623 [Tanacetum coccineum]